MNSSTSSSNDAVILDHWNLYPPLASQVHWTVGVIMCGIFVLTVVGNGTIITLFAKYRSLLLIMTSGIQWIAMLRSATARVATYVLAVADLNMAIHCIPLVIISSFHGNWDFGYNACLYYAFMASITGFVSILILTALAVQRSIVINRSIPRSHPSDQCKTYIAIVTICCMAGTAAALPFFGIGAYVLEGSRTSCTFDQFTRSTINYVYNILIQICFFVIPVFAVITSYISIYIKVRKSERQFDVLKKAFQEMGLRRIRNSRRLEQIEMKTARVSMLIVFIFGLSWLPYFTVSILSLHGDTSIISPIVVSVPGIMAKTGTLLNPLIYALFQNQFRRKLQIVCSRSRPINTINNRGAINIHGIPLMLQHNDTIPTVK